MRPKKARRQVWISKEFDKLLNDLKKQVPYAKSNTDFTDELTATMKAGKVDDQLKRLLRRRYP